MASYHRTGEITGKPRDVAEKGQPSAPALGERSHARPGQVSAVTPRCRAQCAREHWGELHASETPVACTLRLYRI